MSVQLQTFCNELINHDLLKPSKPFSEFHYGEYPIYKPIYQKDLETNPLSITNLTFHYISKDRIYQDLTKSFKDLPNLKMVIFWAYWTFNDKIFTPITINNFSNLLETKIEYLDIINYSLVQKDFEDLGIFLKNSSHIKILKLQNNMIDHENLKYLAEGLEQSKSLTSLHFTNNHLTDSSELFEAINKCTSLVNLDLTSNTIDKRIFSKYLIHNTRIKYLNLSKNHINEEGAKHVGYMAKKMKLIKLDLSYNKIRSGIKDLFEGLKDHEYLESLILHANYIENNSWNIIDFLKSNNKIKKLDLVRNMLENAQFTDIFEGMQYNSSLISLDLSTNPISDISKLKINSLKNIKKLSLSGINLGNHQAKILFKSLKNANDLESLNLSMCGLNEFDDSIMKILDKNKLKVLQLESNYFDEKNILKLCNALKSNKSLIRLDLNKNGFNNLSLKHLCELLKENHTIQYLDIGYNQFTDDGIQYLEFDKMKLKHLSLASCEFSDRSGKNEIIRQLSYNYYLTEFDMEALNRKDINLILCRNKSFITITLKPCFQLTDCQFQF